MEVSAEPTIEFRVLRTLVPPRRGLYRDAALPLERCRAGSGPGQPLLPFGQFTFWQSVPYAGTAKRNKLPGERIATPPLGGSQ